MATFKDPFSVIWPGVEWYWDVYTDRFVCCMEHRGCNLIDYIWHYDGKIFENVLAFLKKLRREINYYLDAIWC